MRFTSFFVAGCLMLGLVALGCGGGSVASTDAAPPVDSGTDVGAVADAFAPPEDAGTDAPVLVDAAGDDAGPRACGGRAGATCETNEFCSFARADICGRADAQGVCVIRPTGCTVGTAQVCGCDGVTYDNECFANAAGTSADHSGPCT